MKDRAFFFGSYEGYRLDAGVNFVEAAPSASAWARAVPAIAALRPGFTAPGAVLLPGASTNPDFDIYQLQGLEKVEEDAFSLRLDYRCEPAVELVLPRTSATRAPRCGRRGSAAASSRSRTTPTNAIFNLQGTMGSGLLNEFKLGYNQPVARSRCRANRRRHRFQRHRDQPDRLGRQYRHCRSECVIGNRRSWRSRAREQRDERPRLIYDPYSLAFSDTVTSVRGNHLTKFGGEARLIRMETDQLGGTTYTFPNVTAFLANQPSAIQYAGDISAPSVFNDGATGPRHTKQEYFVVFGQDEWHASSNLTFNYGLRYEYYTPLRVEDDLIVKFNIDTGQIDPNTTPLHGSKKDNFQPRVSMTYAPGKTVFRVRLRHLRGPGPGRRPDSADRERSRQHDAEHRSVPGVSDQPGPAGRQLRRPTRTTATISRARTRNDYAIPEKVYQYTASVQQDLGGASARRLRMSAARGGICSCAASRTRSRRSSPTRTRRTRRSSIREFSIVTRNASGNVDRRAEPVRRDRLQDQRRPRQLQRADALPEPPVGAGACDERAVHAGQELRHLRRRQRGEYGCQQRAHRRRVRVRRRLQQLRRAPHVQPEPAVLAAVRRGTEIRQRPAAS